MFNQRQFKRALPVLLVLFLTLFLFSSGVESSAYREFPSQLSAADDTTEFLILLKEQADTGLAAARAIVKVPPQASAREQNIAARLAVIESLQQTARASQGSLLRFLGEEMRKGNIESLERFYLVNLIHVRGKSDLIDIIAGRADVAQVFPNERIELIEPETGVSSILAQQGSREWNIDHVGAPLVWDDFGIDGSGVTIGIIDTGVDWQHEALIKQYRGYDPSGSNNHQHQYNWFDYYYPDETSEPDDYHGHGTHCLGTAVGLGSESGNQIGVAPGAQWIAARGLGDDGKGTTASILKAMEFMLAPTPDRYGDGIPNPAMAPDIVSNSWSGGSACNTVFKPAVVNWRNAGILPVFAAGNQGPSAGSIGYPGNYSESFAVGAISSNNSLASFSGRGPGACGSFIKPDLTAPGVDILSALSYNPERERGYVSLNGTSMATPHVAGAAALLLAADPSLDVDQLEEVLIDTAFPLTSTGYPDSPNYGFGHGLLDAYNAVLQVLNSHPLPAIYSISANMESPQETGTELTWTVVAAGGEEPYEYAYYLFRDGARVFTKWYSGDHTFTHLAHEPGEYFVRAFVRDAAGEMDWQNSDLFYFTGQSLLPLAIETILPGAESPQETGTELTWTVVAAGGEEPYEYAYYLFRDGARVFTKWYSGDHTFTHLAFEPGEYFVRAFVRDAAGDTVWRNSAFFNVTGQPLPPLAIETVLPDTESPQAAGIELTWTVEAAGGEEPYSYAYYLFRDGARVFTKWYSGDHTFTHLAFEPGEYFVRAFVRDAAGDTVWRNSAIFIVTDSF